MTRSVIVADCIVSPLGIGSELNWKMMENEISGIRITSSDQLRLKDFYSSSIGSTLLQSIDSKAGIDEPSSKLEKMLVAGIKEVEPLAPKELSSPRTGFIFSSTKGNVDLLTGIDSNLPKSRINLLEMARFVIAKFKNKNEPIVVSNACISGISAIILSDMLLKTKQFDQIVVVGGDITSEFTVSGFNALQAISPFPCRPFDESRAGLSPGEAAGVIVMTLEQNAHSQSHIKVSGGATSNDANHISGPSRTGDGLALAIAKSINIAKIQASDIGYICTHGTATIFNDESESLAIKSLNLNEIRSNSLKGYFGHTFGAAGVIETIITVLSMKKSKVLPSLGYKNHGVSAPMNLLTSTETISLSHSLKTGSGFGGCNAALIFSA